MRLFACFLLGFLLLKLANGNNFSAEFEVAWGDSEHVKVSSNGSLLSLSLDQRSGARLQTYDKFSYARLDMMIKLVPGNSQGTVATFYPSSDGTGQDEIDFEFLGNYAGKDYVLHTNLWTQGMGHREQQFRLWFDPWADFHTYSVIWNPLNIIWYVDDTPVRVFKNYTAKGIAYPYQPMRTLMSIWNGESWATNGGSAKIDWSEAPFTAWYANYRASACTVQANSTTTNSTGSATSEHCSSYAWYDKTLSPNETQRLAWVRDNYMVANYCTDAFLSPSGFPPECSLP